MAKRRHRGGDDRRQGQHRPPATLTVVNGILYFAGDNAARGSDLWRSDGTEAGTTMVKDFGPGSSLYLQPTSTDGALYFTASLGPGPIPNQLWRSDGTGAGTTLIKQAQGGYLSFIATKGRIVYISGGGKLWRSDGTEAGTTIVRVNVPGVNNSTIFPGHLTAVDRTLYFTGTDKRRGERALAKQWHQARDDHRQGHPPWQQQQRAHEPHRGRWHPFLHRQGRQAQQGAVEGRATTMREGEVQEGIGLVVAALDEKQESSHIALSRA